MREVTVPGPRTYPGWMEATAGTGPTWEEPPIPATFRLRDAGWPLAVRFPSLIVGAIDDEGGTWAVTGFEGLYSAASRYESGERGWRDGSWVGRGFLEAKHVTVSVRIRVPEGLAADAIPQRLNALHKALPWRSPAQVVFKDWGHVWAGDALVEDRVEVTRASRWIVEATIPLLIPDPVLLAASWSTGRPAWVTRTLIAGRASSGFTLPVTLPHSIPSVGDGDTRAVFDITGAAPARVILRVSGPIDRAVVTDDAGWETTITGRVDADQELIIDPQTRQVLLDGASRRAWLTGWPHLAPGPHAITWRPEGATADTRLHIDYVETSV